ncbi:MAG: dUTP diphosphatase [Coriobacteriales bacterium]|jgi:dUTP pyrophosphatase|nr:dUTP diphosphatase [Coriobacteriales bacterium]
MAEVRPDAPCGAAFGDAGDAVPASASDALTLRIQRLDTNLPLPAYAYPGDAGLDLRAAADCVLKPGERALIPTGLKLAIPEGFAGFVQPRSGAAARQGLSLVNTPGLIDSQYRGELIVIAINLDGDCPIEIQKGDRIAQLVILPIPRVTLVEVDTLDETERSEKGFGSSGSA